MKVVFTKQLPGNVEIMLRNENIEYSVYEGNEILSGSKLVEFCKDADGIVALLNNQFDSQILNQLNRCKVIANYAVGYNNIDIPAARNKNIIITNTPDVLTDSTADLTIALMLACSRRLIESERFLRHGNFTGWEPQLLLGYDMKGKTFGIVGAGRIGMAAANRAKAFGMKIVYSDRTRKSEFEKETGAQHLELERLLQLSDVVSIHVPLSRETENLINRERLNMLKPNSVFINTARGEIVDEGHLLMLLKSKKIFAAGLDVFQNEPNVNPEFFKLENVVILPHIGSATVEARTQMAELTVRNVIEVLKGNKAITPV